jgi:transcriptional regulator with XRE-family HTH domain
MTTIRIIHPMDKHIGNQLRLRRAMMGLSQSELAQRVGVTFQQIQKYERGMNSISAHRLYDLAVALDVSPLYFYESWHASPQRIGDSLSTQTMHLARDFMDIPSHEIRKSIAALVREVAKGDDSCRV